MPSTLNPSALLDTENSLRTIGFQPYILSYDLIQRKV